MKPALAIALVAACIAAAPAWAQGQAPAPPAPAAPVDYADGANWLCRPGRQDACTIDEGATAVAASGKLTPVPFKAAVAPKIDCFYVYPTVSHDLTPNSDLIPGPEEKGVVEQQFARFSARCRTFAPMYRQVTLTALTALMAGKPVTADRGLAYRDVKAAWDHYLAHDNKGRGVVLIGHSQGSGVLTQLIKEEIDGKPVQARLVSALLLGTSLAVPKNADVGGAFKAIPACRRPEQTGCVVAFASFRATSPPPANSRFGRVAGEGLQALCVNPAALGGGRATLHAYLAAKGTDITQTPTPAPVFVNGGAPLSTPFATVPGLLSGECVSANGFTYLAVTINADPADPRVDDIRGDVRVIDTVLKDWGLHLIDVNLVMGDLLTLVGKEAAAYTAAKH